MKPEERWLKVWMGAFDAMPPLIRILFILFGLIGILVLNIDELQISLPYWLRLIIFAPVAIMLVLWLIPYVLIAWARRISWPFRKAAHLMRKGR